MVRAFIAVDISQDAQKALAEIVMQLQEAGASDVRWVRPEGIHLTLKFLGEIDPALVDRVLQAMSPASQGTVPFTLALSEVGAFPNSPNPRVLWIGLGGELDTLAELQHRVDREVHQATGIPTEARPFSPHLALGRLRDNARTEQRRKVGAAIARLSLTSQVPWVVSDVHLYRSTLTPSGAEYDRLGSVSF